ncbi:hypothetical protein [Streptomyces beihaiensis]|uniref:Uncharacterized protein n=1 Tax=Streptomyces beihaiensis TaxID=2984495 RepID=A0ABT3TPV8_9ACTN|nr:hypothetical protein [Streptomyces beihaiensis]MCX3059069.1 hypothetical protein [Streptomyces beihaiensis]
MPDTPQQLADQLDTEKRHAPPARQSEPGPAEAPSAEDGRGCLFALSQPPLMIFLTVIGCLLLMAALHDLLLL